MRNVQSGSLILEIAISLAILALLATAVLTGISGADHDREQKLADASLDAASEAVRGFVLREKRLPCPALAYDGYETCGAGLNAGFLPYAALQIDRPAMPQGASVRYGVGQRLADAAASGINGFMTELARPVGETPQGQPFVAGANDAGRAANCAVNASRPAFALSVATDATAASAASLCFTDSGDTGPRVRATSRSELLGWVRARFL